MDLADCALWSRRRAEWRRREELRAVWAVSGRWDWGREVWDARIRGSPILRLAEEGRRAPALTKPVIDGRADITCTCTGTSSGEFDRSSCLACPISLLVLIGILCNLGRLTEGSGTALIPLSYSLFLSSCTSRGLIVTLSPDPSDL